MTAALLVALLAAAPARAGEPAPAAAVVTKTAAAGPKGIELPGVDAELKAPDMWVLHGRYQAAADPTKLTLVLLHGRGQKKEVWLRLCRDLMKEGFGYLALDLRGHGQSQTGPDGQPHPWRQFKATSKGENDYAGMALDVQAAVDYLAGQGVVEERVGLVGDALGGNVALKYAAVHPKIPLIVMLSPGLNYQEITSVNAIRAYKDRPILMIYGDLDKTASASVPVLNAFAQRSAGERNTTVVAVPNVHGVKLLTPAVATQIVEWIKNPVKPEHPPEVSTTTPPGAPPAAPAPDNGAPPAPPADAQPQPH